MNKKKMFFANTFWLIGGRVFQMLISLVVGALTARYLGTSNYGIINYIAAYVTFFTSVANLGINVLVVKKLVGTPDDEGTILGTAIFMQLCSGLLSALMVIGVVIIIHPDDVTTIYVSVLESVSLIVLSFETLGYWYQAKLQSKFNTIITSIAYIGMTVYRIILLILQKDVCWFAFATSLDHVLIALLLLISYKRHGGHKFSLSKTLGRSLLKGGYHFILSGLIISVYSQMDKIMIRNMMNESYVGLYSAAAMICLMWTFVLQAIIDSATPLIMEAKSTNEDLYIKRVKQLYAAIIWISAFAQIIISIFSKQIILIIYGAEYVGATAALRIATWYTGFAFLGSARNIWIICEEKQRLVKYFLGVGAVVNLILNWILIPIHGIEGAAFATLITQITTSLVVPIFFKDTRITSKQILEAAFFKGIDAKATIYLIIDYVKRKLHA